MKCVKNIREVDPVGFKVGPTCYSLKLITFQLTETGIVCVWPCF